MFISSFLLTLFLFILFYLSFCSFRIVRCQPHSPSQPSFHPMPVLLPPTNERCAKSTFYYSFTSHDLFTAKLNCFLFTFIVVKWCRVFCARAAAPKLALALAKHKTFWWCLQPDFSEYTGGNGFPFQIYSGAWTKSLCRVTGKEADGEAAGLFFLGWR